MDLASAGTHRWVLEEAGPRLASMASPTNRREAAVLAAHALAQSFGVPVTALRVLKDSNNTIVHLSPAPLVAKVGTSHFRDAELEALDRELAVGLHLAAKQAPTVRPSSDVSPGPHEVGGLTVTLWQFYDAVSTPPPASSSLGPSLSIVHDALRDYPGALPSFEVEMVDAARFLADRSKLGRLSDRDYEFLRGVHAELAPAVSNLGLDGQPLHGSPHSGNWLSTHSELLLLDFETACRGPLEWDLSAMGDDDIRAFPSVDREALSLLRRVRSLCVAVKCWIEPDRAPEVAEAADVHLRLLRGEALS
jgi:hypothetical protein